MPSYRTAYKFLNSFNTQACKYTYKYRQYFKDLIDGY